MIVADTSALMAILLDEADADSCIAALEEADDVLMSAATLAEALIVADRRNVARGLDAIVTGLGIEIVPVTSTDARNTANAYARWGKGIDPAGLNFGDCFAYALAEARACPLLYVGQDFARTDIASAIRPA